MKAIRYYGQNDIRCEEVATPAPELGGLLVKVEACAICGADLKMFLKGDPRVPRGQTIGHEFVGTVAAIGSNVHDVEVGEVVSGEGTLFAGAAGTAWPDGVISARIRRASA